MEKTSPTTTLHKSQMRSMLLRPKARRLESGRCALKVTYITLGNSTKTLSNEILRIFNEIRRDVEDSSDQTTTAQRRGVYNKTQFFGFRK